MKRTSRKKVRLLRLSFFSLLSLLAACSTPTNKYANVPTQKTDIAAYNPSTYSYAYSYFEQRAEKGDPIAEDNLGRMYADGRGAPESPEQSVYWYSKAAAQHNADAELNLGVATLYGRGLAQDTAKACDLFSQAKHDGSAYAQEFYNNSC